MKFSKYNVFYEHGDNFVAAMSDGKGTSAG